MISSVLALLLALACGGAMNRVDELISERRAALDRGTLMIPSGSLTDAELSALLADPRVPPLRDLSLHRNRLTALSASTIAASGKLRGLKNLNLSMNPLGNDGVAILADSAVLDPLGALSLAAVGATSDGVAALAASPHVDRVAELDLGFQAVADAGALALSDMASRDKLLLQQAEIGGVGARALIERSRARSLKLEENPLGRGGLAGLTRVSPAIVSLDLTNCRLATADVISLASVPASGLESLVLDYNAAGDDGLRALASAAWLDELQFLSVMGFEGGQAARAELREAWGERPGLTLER